MHLHKFQGADCATAALSRLITKPAPRRRVGSAARVVHCVVSRRTRKGYQGARQMRPGLLAFAAASAFVGAALYINLVEQPARLALDARSMVREWAPSNRRGFVMLASLAVISAISAYVDFTCTGDVRWLISGTVILASW